MINIDVFPLECKDHLDCPNGGDNYECVANECKCAPGYLLDGDDCLGMLLN